ncbi:hypothetical protein SEA_CHIPPER1996_61 [Arthrobacter phage Chipper1996]|uniref:Uncharacterized protein n=3 Tax=Klausavirus princesstrina TaxID=1984784 RepID=A0A286N474_9CAUD|nr:hypothetical protein SEA_TOPHAT_61 [Arthrobacter phage Tophat]QBP30432.1 hypothetical protein SEA_CHIPPER1996_61 [Arthrobacter phage Chipper1996]QEQ94167.1 hypothetical protein SEA_MORDRED_61 [Arthrobacter phage Mordred]
MNSLTDPQGIKATARAIFEGGREHPLADLARLIEGAISDAKFAGLAPFDIARWVAHVIDHHGYQINPDSEPASAHVDVDGTPHEAPTVPDAGEYPKVEWNDSRPVTVSYRVPTMSATTPDPVLSAEVLGRIERDTRRANPWDNFKPEFKPFPKLDLSGIPAMPVDVKESLEAAAELMRESMERAAKAVRKSVDDARAAEARRILAEQPHEHIYGRGSNGLCRICGNESNSRRARAKRRAIHNEKAKKVAQWPQHALGERVEQAQSGRLGRITKTVNAEGHVHVVWDQEPGTTVIVAASHLSAPASRLHEALKAKGDGGDE